MAANVCCAGGSAWLREHSWTFQVINPDMLRLAETGPCGWKGKRRKGDLLYAPTGRVFEAEAEPCPRCGGRVELIGEETTQTTGP